MAPEPPFKPMKPMSTYLSFFSGSMPVVSEHSRLFQPAVTRSGITGASARWIASALGGHKWLPKVVAFGYEALRIVPSGITISIGSTMPSLCGMSGLIICSSVSIVADALDVNVPFTNPLVWGSVRE